MLPVAHTLPELDILVGANLNDTVASWRWVKFQCWLDYPVKLASPLLPLCSWQSGSQEGVTRVCRNVGCWERGLLYVCSVSRRVFLRNNRTGVVTETRVITSLSTSWLGLAGLAAQQRDVRLKEESLQQTSDYMKMNSHGSVQDRPRLSRTRVQAPLRGKRKAVETRTGCY